MFRVLFALIIWSTTAAYSHRLCMVLVCYSIEAGTGFGTPLRLSTQPMAIRGSCVPDNGCK
jgi:hypothetical protein